MFFSHMASTTNHLPTLGTLRSMKSADRVICVDSTSGLRLLCCPQTPQGAGYFAADTASDVVASACRLINLHTVMWN